ncbi:MAG: flagellar brake protein [Pseudomonadota bacterium]
MKASSYVSDNDEEFAIYNRDDIVMILQGLAQKSVALSATFNAGMEVLLTAVIGVDPKRDLVYLDVNANSEFNEHLLASKRVTFNAFFNGAKVMWSSTSVKDAVFEGGKAFCVVVPERLQRIQRRGSYRVNTPIINPVICQIPVKANQVLSVPLFDICVEGIGVVLPSPLAPEFQKFAEFKNCKIEHPDLGEVNVALFVKSIWEITLKNGNKAQRAGLEFADITPGTQSKIQRFVYKMERQLIATTKA